VADLLAVAAGVAELAPRRELGLALGHALGAELGDELVEVELHLRVERSLLLAAAEEAARHGAQPAEALADHGVSSVSMLRTLATAEAKDSQCSRSASSCFLPTRVNR